MVPSSLSDLVLDFPHFVFKCLEGVNLFHLVVPSLKSWIGLELDMSPLRQAIRKSHGGARLISVEQLLRLIDGCHGLALIFHCLLLSTHIRGVRVGHVNLAGGTLIWSRRHLSVLPHLCSVILLLIHQIFIIIVFISHSASLASFKSLPLPLQPPYLPHQCLILLPDLLLPLLIHPLKHPI